MQMASLGTVRMRGTLGQRGKKDYALLNAERIVYISFVINTFQFFKKFFNLFFSFDVCSLNVSVLVFRSTKRL